MPAGRPKKYTSKEEAREVNRQLQRQRYLRRRMGQSVEFVPYEPAIPGNVPSETNPRLGLRISPDIGVPEDPADENNQEPAGERADFQPPAFLPATREAAEDAELAAQIRKIQVNEIEENRERDEREAAIRQQIAETEKSVTETPVGLPSGNGGTSLPRPESVGTADHVDIGNTPASLSSRATSVRAGTPRASQTPSQTSAKSKSRAQTNTLLSWLQGSAPQSPVNRITPGSPASSTSLRPPPPPVSISRSSQPAATSSPTIAPRPPSNLPPHPSPTPAGNLQAPASGTGSPTPQPQESTALQLARQLRRFQGCTHEEHGEADRLHHQRHQRADVHSACSSMQEITTIVRGESSGTVPIPDVVSNPKLMKLADVRGMNLKSIFEGTDPNDAGTPDEDLPRNLCMSQHHTTSPKNRAPLVTFDIDSTCCFPTSLAVARQGINWYVKAHGFMNIDGDVHFSLKMPYFNQRNELVEKAIPLHKIPHYCFGSVIGMESLLMFVFFPALRLDYGQTESTYMSSEDQELWYDAVLKPALQKAVKAQGQATASSILQNYHSNSTTVGLASTALTAESHARGKSAREQLIKQPLQPGTLNLLWTYVLESIEENPGFERFKGATLFMNAKNTKVEFINKSPEAAYSRWEQKWNRATDPEFYSRQKTYVDLAKMVTSEDSHDPYDKISDHEEAEVYLWKRCCLEAYARKREVVREDGSRRRGSPKVTEYPWALTRDVMGMTLFAPPSGKENVEGLVYSQFYGMIKTPFDSSKQYIFSNEALENLALDPGYVRSLHQQGGASNFSKAACEFGYLHSKRRAHANLQANRWKSYGTREEHRISLVMADQICDQWRQWDLYDDSTDGDADLPLPYYIVPSRPLLGFLSAQINKHCFLFEHTLAQTSGTYSLPETMVMVIALRALRFCYGSNLLQRESLLFKNRWEPRRGEGRPIVVKEGVGFQETMERCGLGWFVSKFNWDIQRLSPSHVENMLVGNLLMHTEYKKRWRAVKDLRDAFVRFSQAQGWYDKYQMGEKPGLRARWLEYLHALNLQQFDADVWNAMLSIHKRNGELSPEAAERNGPVAYCYSAMATMFLRDGALGPPHIATGNKMRFHTVGKLLDFLFRSDDGQTRAGWGEKPFRIILDKSWQLIKLKLGRMAADLWLGDFYQLVRLTHWVLPYPSSTALIQSTKTSHAQGLSRRAMWFSAVYDEPEVVDRCLPRRPNPNPQTLFTVIWREEQATFGLAQQPRPQRPMWGTKQLIRACQRRGIGMVGQGKGEEDYWTAGKRSVGVDGFAPRWERGRPPTLAMLERTKKMTLEELEDLVMEWTQDPDLEVEHRREQAGNDAGRRSILELFRPPPTSSTTATENREQSHGDGSSHGVVGPSDESYVPSEA